MKKLFLLLCVVILQMNGTTFAQTPYDHCAQIIDRGPFDITIIQNDMSKQKFAHLWLCSQQYNDSKDEIGLKIEAVYKGITGKTDYSSSKFMEYKDKYCSSDIGTYSSSEKSYLYSQIANKDIISAWKDCIGRNNKNLICIASPDTGSEFDSFAITLNHGPDGNIENAELLLHNFEIVFNKTLPTILKQGDEFNFILKRKDKDQSGIIQVNGTSNNGNRNCTFIVPKELNITPPDIKLLKIMQIIKPDKISNNLIPRTFSHANCTVRVSEKLSIHNYSINQNKTKLVFPYTCTRPDHSYNCGGPWSHNVDASYQSKVTADLEISNGELFIKNIVNENSMWESSCGKLIVDFLRSISGSAL